MKRRNIITIIIGIVAVIISAISVVILSNPGPYSIALFDTGLALIIISLIRHIKYGKGIEKDERTMQNVLLSQTITFQLSLIFLAILWWVNYAFPLNISNSLLIALIISSMAIIAIIVSVINEYRLKR